MKHIFRLLKTSWGIVVYIEVEEQHGEDISSYDFQVTDNIFLKLHWTPSLYKELVLAWLAKAVRDCIQHIPQASKICFDVVELDFNECDFQEEGLYYVMLEWLSKRYEFELPKLDAYYNKEKNRYIFPALNKNV